MSQLDYYKVLGLSKSATADDIRKAYKKLARENHPDRKPNDKAAEARFKEIQEAHSVLGDPQKRAQYDQFGSGFNARSGHGQTWSTGPGGAQVDLGDLFSGGGGVDLNDILGGAFGGFGRGGRQPVQSRKGGDLKAEIQIPFQVAVEGGNQEISIRRENGPVDRLSVKIPAGISDGAVIRLAGQGGSGRFGGPSGDVLVTIKVASHPFFRREQNNLLVDLPLTISEATLGAKIEVHTLSEGNVVMTVPAGTSSGSMLRLREKGVPDAKTGKRGDQLVVIKVVVPKVLSDRARQLLDELANEAPQSVRDGLWS